MNAKTSKATLFLIEFIIIITFFSFAGAVCMNVFAKAKTISARSTELTMAVLQTQDVAELLKAEDLNAQALLSLGALEMAGGYVIHYDGDWNVDADPVIYRMRIQFNSQDGVERADISVLKMDEVIYEIQVAKAGGA